MGYDYGAGSLDELAKPQLKAEAKSTGGRVIKVSKLNRAARKGSFIITAHAVTTDANGNTQKELLGVEAVLSRWSVVKCANCLTHLETKAFFKIPAKHQLNLLSSGDLQQSIQISVHDRSGLVTGGDEPAQTTEQVKLLNAQNAKQLYQLEIL